MSSFFSRARLPLAIIALIAISGVMACSRAQNQPKVPLGQTSAAAPAPSPRDALSDEAKAALDQGNLEYRAGRFEQALAAYRKAAKAAPDNSAPFFGIFMAAKKLGNKSLADSASSQIASLAGSNPMLSDSSMRAIHATATTKPKA
jgi:Flp pilus assembly protein TadD